MEGIDFELIFQIASLLVTSAIGVYLVGFRRREIEASTADHNVSAMETVIKELRQKISDQFIEQMETNEELARLRLDIARQAAEHQETVNALNKRVQNLERQLSQEQVRREQVEEENRRLRDGVKKLEERLETKETTIIG